MTNFFHKLLNPHCEHCREQEELEFQRRTFNPIIEHLKDEIARLQRHNDLLMQKLESVKQNDVTVEATTNSEPPVPIRPNRTPWIIKQRELEAEDRNKARVLRKLQEAGIDLDRPMPLSDLDKEILEVKERIENAG